MAEVLGQFLRLEEKNAKQVGAMQRTIDQLRETQGSASSQGVALHECDFVPFQLEADPQELRMVRGLARAFGFRTLNSLVDGENLLHKMIGLGSPPFNNEGAVEGVAQLLTIIGDTSIDIHARCLLESNRRSRTAVDICCENKSPNGVKPEMLKLLLGATASVNAVSQGKPPLFFAAGTGNLACVKVLIEFRADVTVKWDGSNLAPHYSYLIALPSTFHSFFGAKPEYQFFRC